MTRGSIGVAVFNTINSRRRAKFGRKNRNDGRCFHGSSLRSVIILPRSRREISNCLPVGVSWLARVLLVR